VGLPFLYLVPPLVSFSLLARNACFTTGASPLFSFSNTITRSSAAGAYYGGVEHSDYDGEIGLGLDMDEYAQDAQHLHGR
jgi:hypothetical protein